MSINLSLKQLNVWYGSRKKKKKSLFGITAVQHSCFPCGTQSHSVYPTLYSFYKRIQSVDSFPYRTAQKNKQTMNSLHPLRINIYYCLCVAFCRGYIALQTSVDWYTVVVFSLYSTWDTQWGFVEELNTQIILRLKKKSIQIYVDYAAVFSVL